VELQFDIIALPAQVKLPAGLPWSVTDSNNRQRQMPASKQYWPPTLCVGRPVTMQNYKQQNAT